MDGRGPSDPCQGVVLTGVKVPVKRIDLEEQVGSWLQAIADPARTPQEDFSIQAATVDGKPAWVLTRG